MKEQLYLIGFMGSGKSAVSRYLMKHFGVKILEMDEQLEKDVGKTISRIFAEDGEEVFRQMETDLLRRLGAMGPLVVSCGGGTPLRQENVQLMKEHGTVVFLQASAGTIYERVKDRHNRPLLEGHMNPAYIESMMEKRRPVYEEAADLVISVDGKSLGEICALLPLEPDAYSGRGDQNGCNPETDP